MGSEREIKYGPSKSETLDLFFPNGESGGPAARPIHVFFHGGYWRALHKNDFSYVANAFSGSNAICAVVNYGLVPEVTLDELVEQCRRAMIWIWRNIADFGGSPHRITASGHSAGGHLVGMMMATDWTKYYHLCPADLVKGGVAISGLFDLEPIRLCFLNQTLKLDADSARRNSPMYLPNRNLSELVCYFGALEGSEYRWQSETLASKWKRTEAIVLPGHDHFTIARELNDPGSEISKRVRRLMGM
ncbi:MAG: alpha/beta hydrolase [Gammaproteobacteria bacterium]